MSAIIPFDQIDHIDPNRKVRSITRTPDVDHAFAIVSNVLMEAQKMSSKSPVEIRFYDSEELPGVGDYGALQLFDINSDDTVTPIGEMQSLPPHIVVSLNEFPLLVDNKNKWACIDMNAQTMGNLIFMQTNISSKIPDNDRMLTFLDGKIYEDGGSDILAKVYWHAATPGIVYRDSRVTRPKQ